MKILGVLGSPRSNGATAQLLNAMTDAASRNGHEIEIINLAKMDIRNCISCDQCKNGKIEFCSINDDMQSIYPKIVNADTLIFATPVYMAQISAQMKSFLDRWNAFLDKDHKVRLAKGKKFITITTSGAPSFVFCRSVTNYMKFTFRFFSFTFLKSLNAGSMRDSSIEKQPNLLTKAQAIGAGL